MKLLDGSEGKKFADLKREESLQFHIVHTANTIDTFLEKSLDSQSLGDKLKDLFDELEKLIGNPTADSTAAKKILTLISD